MTGSKGPHRTCGRRVRCVKDRASVRGRAPPGELTRRSWWAFCHGMANLLSVRYHWASESLSKSVDVATEAIQPFSFTTFCIKIKKYNTPNGFNVFLTLALLLSYS